MIDRGRVRSFVQQHGGGRISEGALREVDAILRGLLTEAVERARRQGRLVEEPDIVSVWENRYSVEEVRAAAEEAFDDLPEDVSAETFGGAVTDNLRNGREHP